MSRKPRLLNGNFEVCQIQSRMAGIMETNKNIQSQMLALSNTLSLFQDVSQNNSSRITLLGNAVQEIGSRPPPVPSIEASDEQLLVLHQMISEQSSDAIAESQAIHARLDMLSEEIKAVRDHLARLDDVIKEIALGPVKKTSRAKSKVRR